MAETTSKATPKKATTKPAVTSDKPAAKKPVAAKAAVASSVKPVTKKAEPAKSVAKPAAVRKPAAEKKPAAKTTTSQPSGKAMVISDEQRYRMVAEAAYYRAESNQFKSDPLRDWIEAESDIASLLSGRK